EITILKAREHGIGHLADTRLYGKQSICKVPFLDLGLKKAEQVLSNGHCLPVWRRNIRRTILNVSKHNGCNLIDIQRNGSPSDAIFRGNNGNNITMWIIFRLENIVQAI